MGGIKVVIEDELLKKFKEEAMKKFGYTRGSLSIAAREAFKKWLEVERGEEKTKEFSKAIEEVAGIWKAEEGYEYVRKIRKESEKRLKRFKI
ncbi:MAG: hypothetical protein NZ942_01840 [Candidatus Aenigmarchaeota archaeon]|nr:hypothetical protein [Candidatus Aenigmarchaeota archaeon]